MTEKRSLPIPNSYLSPGDAAPDGAPRLLQRVSTDMSPRWGFAFAFARAGSGSAVRRGIFVEARHRGLSQFSD
jgi:hypothetical protein